MALIGVIARKPRPIPAELCSIDVTDLADIFTVGRPYKVTTKIKISAQMDKPLWRYRHYKCRWSPFLECFILQHFLVNFHFLKNGKSFNQDFFTIDTIDDGLSVGGIENVLSSNFFCFVLHFNMSTYIMQVGRISAVGHLESSLIWKSTSNYVERCFQKFVILNFAIQNFSNKTRKAKLALDSDYEDYQHVLKWSI